MVLFQVFQHRRISNILLQLAKDKKIQGCTVNPINDFIVSKYQSSFRGAEKLIHTLLRNIKCSAAAEVNYPVLILCAEGDVTSK